MRAYNLTGLGPPQFSTLTKVVRPLVSLAWSQGSVIGLTGGAPKLILGLAVPTGQPPLKKVTLWLPKGLTLSRGASQAIQVLGTHRHRFRLSGSAHRLEIVCMSRTPALRVTIPPSALKADAPLARRARAHRLQRLSLTLFMAEVFGGSARFTIKLAAR